jgi:hypothetical protein
LGKGPMQGRQPRSCAPVLTWIRRASSGLDLNDDPKSARYALIRPMRNIGRKT